MMENSNKDLLDLEAKPGTISSSSTLESKLFVLKKDGPFSSSHAPFQKPSISSLPKSQVLGKVKDFLGVLRIKQKADGRCKGSDVGIADLHTREAVAAAESAIGSYQKPLHLAESSSDEDSSDDEEKEEEKNQEQYDEAGTESGLMKAAERHPSSQESKKQKPKKRSKIVEIA